MSETSPGVTDSPVIDVTASRISDVATLSFEQARDELVRVVAELEQGAPTLEHSLALWERGEALAERCEEWLLGAKRRLDASRSNVTGTQATAKP